MAKGSIRKKGKKWYYRFYVEDASGNLVQKECAGTESKKFIAKADNITLGQLLDTWAEEELKVGTLRKPDAVLRTVPPQLLQRST